MSKVIIIESCLECPNRGHGGGFANVAYKPYCNLMDRQSIPHTEHVSQGRIVAMANDGVPDWCPLEDR